MSEIQRYDIHDYIDGGMKEADSGEYVLYTNHVAALAEKQAEYNALEKAWEKRGQEVERITARYMGKDKYVDKLKAEIDRLNAETDQLIKDHKEELGEYSYENDQQRKDIVQQAQAVDMLRNEISRLTQAKADLWATLNYNNNEHKKLKNRIKKLEKENTALMVCGACFHFNECYKGNAGAFDFMWAVSKAHNKACEKFESWEGRTK